MDIRMNNKKNISMKNLKLIAIALIALFTSCDNNDDAQTNITIPTDGFTHNGQFFETPNMYLEINEDDSDNDNIPDSYTIFFSNGRMFDNDANVNGSSGDYLFSLNTTNFVFLQVYASENPDLTVAGPLPGNTYIVNNTDDSLLIENAQITPLNPSYITNGIEFGMGDENYGTIITPNNTNPTITLNELNIDNNTPANSTVDIDYTFTAANGDIITGHYSGTYGVIQD